MDKHRYGNTQGRGTHTRIGQLVETRCLTPFPLLYTYWCTYTDSNVSGRTLLWRRRNDRTFFGRRSTLDGRSLPVYCFSTPVGGRLSIVFVLFCWLPKLSRRTFLDLRRFFVYSDLLLGRGQIGVSSDVGVYCGDNIGTLWDSSLGSIWHEFENWVSLKFYFLRTTKFVGINTIITVRGYLLIIPPVSLEGSSTLELQKERVWNR